MDSDVIVIGAGAAGIAAARTLVAASRKVVVLEARSRIGGRVFTDRSFAPFPVERGAEFVHGKRSRTHELVRELGLRSAEALQLHRAVVAREGRVRSLLPWLLTTPAAWGVASAAMSLVRAKTDRGSVADLIAQRSTETRLMVEALCNSAGADPVDLSVSELARLARESDESGGTHRLLDGYDQLLQTLAGGLDIRLSTPVDTVEWGSHGVSVDGIRARRAIVTVPVSLLQHGAIRFAPELPAAKRQAIDALRMAPALKAFLRFKERFWPERASAMVVDGWPPVAWAARPGEPVLVAFATGRRALAADEAVVERTLATLSASFGRDVRGSLCGADVANWTTDPWTRGGYSSVPPGASFDARSALGQPIGALYFAGEATDLISPGTVSGALRSGERSARELLAQAT